MGVYIARSGGSEGVRTCGAYACSVMAHTVYCVSGEVCVCMCGIRGWEGVCVCVCVVHAHLICNGHQDVMESSEILSISHRGTAPRHVDIIPLSLLLPNIGVASVWSAWIEHPVFIAMKRDIEHPVRGGTREGRGIHWLCTRDYNVSIISCEPIREQSSNAAAI